MDVGSLTGVILGIGLILGSIMLQGALGPFISVSSILIVLGGTIAATLINFNLSQAFASLYTAVSSFKD